MDKATFEGLSKDEKIRTLEGYSYFSHVHTPDMQTAARFSATPYYSIQLGLEGQDLQNAKDWGLRVKPASDAIPYDHVQIKRRVKDLSDPQASKPDLVDSLQNDIPPAILIGNGSKVACRFGTYWYDANGGGVGTTLFKTQVKDLIPFEKKGEGVDAVDGGGWSIGADAYVDEEPLFDDAAAG